MYACVKTFGSQEHRENHWMHVLKNVLCWGAFVAGDISGVCVWEVDSPSCVLLAWNLAAGEALICAPTTRACRPSPPVCAVGHRLRLPHLRVRCSDRWSTQKKTMCLSARPLFDRQVCLSGSAPSRHRTNIEPCCSSWLPLCCCMLWGFGHSRYRKQIQKVLSQSAPTTTSQGKPNSDNFLQ